MELPRAEVTPVVENESKEQTTVLVNYKSENLTILNNHHANLGELKITGYEAKKLFEALRIKVVVSEATLIWTLGQIKDGEFLKCTRQSYKNKPRQFIHTCIVNFDHKRGILNEVSSRPNKDKKVPLLLEDFNGKIVDLTVEGRKVIFTLKGKDAEALYTALAVPEFSQTIANRIKLVKSADGYSCHQLLEDSEGQEKSYQCLMHLSYLEGAVLKISEK